MSLLNELRGETVGPSGSISWAARSLVVVFPADPVMPTTTGWPIRSSTARASWPSAAVTSGTISAGAPTGRGASEVVAVGPLPRQRGEQAARFRLPRVDHDRAGDQRGRVSDPVWPGPE